MKRPDNGLPEDIREHMRLMCDIVALAFQTDKTRVATLLLCRDISGLFYPFLDARKAHHSASHDDLSDEYERIIRYYVSQLAYLAGRLDAMPEGDGTVLDHSCLLYLSNMWSGSKHDSTKLPLLLVGGLGGTLETGRVLDYLDAGDDNRKLCSLYLSIMDRMGVKLERFGDADDAARRSLDTLPRSNADNANFQAGAVDAIRQSLDRNLDNRDQRWPDRCMRPAARGAGTAKPLKALLVIGGCCHDYAKQKDILAKGHRRAGQCRGDDRLRPRQDDQAPQSASMTSPTGRRALMSSSTTSARPT